MFEVNMESINRQEIINIATGLFRKKGYTATSIGEIVSACGVTKGALYHYFKSKEELAFEVIKQVKDYFEVNIFILAKGIDTDNMLVQLTQFNLKIETFFSTHKDGCLLANLTLEMGANYEIFKDEILGYFQTWERCYFVFFSKAYPKAKAQILAADALASVQGCVLMYRASGDLTMLKRQHHNMIEMCKRK